MANELNWLRGKATQRPSDTLVIKPPRIEPGYTPRFVTVEQGHKLVSLYHLARTALSGKSCTPYDRMVWASKEFARGSNSVSESAAYKDLCGLLGR